MGVSQGDGGIPTMRQHEMLTWNGIFGEVANRQAYPNLPTPLPASHITMCSDALWICSEQVGRGLQQLQPRGGGGGRKQDDTAPKRLSLPTYEAPGRQAQATWSRHPLPFTCKDHAMKPPCFVLFWLQWACAGGAGFQAFSALIHFKQKRYWAGRLHGSLCKYARSFTHSPSIHAPFTCLQSPRMPVGRGFWGNSSIP